MKLTFKVWILIFFLIIGILMIKPTFQSGVIITSIEKNSLADSVGLTKGEIIKEINGKIIENLEDYAGAITIQFENATFTIETSGGIFSYEGKEIGFDVDNLRIYNVSSIASKAGITENSSIINVNGNSIEKESEFYAVKADIEPRESFNMVTNKDTYNLLISEPLKITVDDIPKTRIKTGLDLQGGARGLVKPERKISSQEMNDLLAVSKQRLNVYGVSDVSIRSTTDLSGNRYVLVEVAGATPTELRELIAKQGKFEAKIGNETVFIGGSRDITSVCRNDRTCSGIESCFPVEGGYACQFMFAVYLSEEAAERHANITSKLEVNVSEGGAYLDKKLDLYLDDSLVDSLLISEDLRGKATTQIQVQGSGIGEDEEQAYNAAEDSMQKLQTILITGSLPFKLEIVKLDSISPKLGNEFVKNIAYASIAAFIIVSLVITIRYRKFKTILLVLLTMFSEVFLVLAIAAFIKWNIDLPSIAGLIAVIGTGVNDQIVILDEGEVGKSYSWKERLKKAFAIILGAYAATFAAMIPLGWAGAGLLKGFAITTIIGITVGVLITRPAFADLVSKIEK